MVALEIDRRQMYRSDTRACNHNRYPLPREQLVSISPLTSRSIWYTWFVVSQPHVHFYRLLSLQPSNVTTLVPNAIRSNVGGRTFLYFRERRKSEPGYDDLLMPSKFYYVVKALGPFAESCRVVKTVSSEMKL